MVQTETAWFIVVNGNLGNVCNSETVEDQKDKKLLTMM